MEKIERTEVLASFGDYNPRRYSKPWVGTCDDTGRISFDFVGRFTGNSDDGGDIVIFNPVEGQVYAYGQKDYRKPRYTLISFKKWTGETFVKCDRLGRDKESINGS